MKLILLENVSSNLVSYFLITIGDIGEKFYIILDGRVSVLVPRKKEKPQEEDAKMEESMQNKAYVKQLSMYGAMGSAFKKKLLQHASTMQA